MKVQKTISLDAETAALAAEQSNFSEFVRRALHHQDQRKLIEHLEELEAINAARRTKIASWERQVMGAYERRDWPAIKQLLIGAGLI